MLRLLGLLCVAASCYATSMRFPTTGTTPCILLDITVHNRLSWTNSSKQTEFVPDWTFNGSTTVSGNCGANNRQLSRTYAEDGATFTFTFTNSSGQISVVMDLRFSPDDVFKNGEAATVDLALPSVQLSSDDKAFECNTFDVMTLTKAVGNNSYFISVQVETMHVQAFNVENGTFSEDEECKVDVTTEPPATTKPTTEPVTNHTTKPTNHTTVTTPKTPKTTPEPTPTNSHPKTTVSVMDMGVTCIVMQGEFLFTLPYTKKDGTNATATVGLQDIQMNKTTGTCNSSSNMNSIKIKFLDTWLFDITFMKDGAKVMLADDDTKYWWSDVAVTYTLDEKTFPDHATNTTTMTVKQSFADKKQFSATVSGSYMCNADSTLDLGNDGFKMETWNLQYKAFQAGNDTKFSDDNVQECSADAKTNSIVPIAVGAALAGLVVIVLIAYLIGRRRNRKGYESV